MPTRKPPVPASQTATELTDEGVPTIFATHLMYWRRVGDTVWLTFTEERPAVPEKSSLKSHVVARIAMPASSLPAAAVLVQDAATPRVKSPTAARKMN